jgi:hypothetical protein
MYTGDRGSNGFVLNKRRSRLRLLIGEVLRALVIFILGGMLAWMILCAPKAGAAGSPSIELEGPVSVRGKQAWRPGSDGD